MIQGVARWDRKRNEDVQSNMRPIVQVINKNKLRWFGHEEREEKSIPRVVIQLKMKGKNPRIPRLIWQDNFESNEHIDL